MQIIKSIGLSGAMLAALLTVTPAGAMPIAAKVGNLSATNDAPVIDVRYRGHRHRHHRGNAGAAIAAGAALGIIGGIVASQARPRYYEAAPVYEGDVHDYCFSKFKSYDPRSGTYLGYDGYRHPCP